MNESRIRSLIGAVTLQALYAVVVCANPSHKSPDASLDAHGKETSSRWHKEASDLYEIAARNLTGFLEKEQSERVKNIKADDLGKTHLMVTMMARGGDWMQIWGEPAGADFTMRAQVMHSHLSRLIEASKAFPATQKHIQNFREYLANHQPGLTKALGNLEKLCNEKKWPAAESLLFKVYDTLEPGTVFLTPQENQAIYKPFAQVDQAITTAMVELRSASADEELKKLIQELTPDFAALRQEIDAAVNSIGTSGTATWRNEPVTGPQLVEKIGQTWKETQVAALQCRAKKWALAFRSGNAPNSLGIDSNDPQANDQITNAFAAFSGEVRKSLVKLLAADAARIPPDGAKGLYVEYLRVFAPLVRQANHREWSDELEATFSKFAGKSPELEREVKNYIAATAEVLRWRSRIAAAQLAAKATDYAPLEERFRAGTSSGRVENVDYRGLFAEGYAEPQLHANSVDIMPIAVQRLINQKASVRDVLQISAESKTSIARYTRRTYANLPAPLDLSKEVGALKTDLLISDQAPPLSLSAARAIQTADRGDLIAAGGTISGVYLEGVITRFATLPVGAAVLTELGQLPAERFDGGQLHNMLMRFDLTPQWACHDYFFVDLAPPANLTAALTGQPARYLER